MIGYHFNCRCVMGRGIWDYVQRATTLYMIKSLIPIKDGKYRTELIGVSQKEMDATLYECPLCGVYHPTNEYCGKLNILL